VKKRVRKKKKWLRSRKNPKQTVKKRLRKQRLKSLKQIVKMGVRKKLLKTRKTHYRVRGREKNKKKIVSKPIKPKTSEAAKHASYSAPVFEFPHILRIIGPKHIKIMMNFVPTAIFYSLTSLILLTYMAEWRTVLQYLPYYNGKYVEEKTESTKENEEEET
jgi:ubiquinol-cytochrome c reductase subunit 10